MLRITSILVLLTIFSRAIAQECGNKGEQCSTSPSTFDQDADWKSASSVYDFHAKDIKGNDVPLKDYEGHVLIIANVASNCGLTERNYKQFQELYNKYEKDGLRILAFPSNQFAGQEPGTAEEIQEFVKQYNVTFDMFDKIDVNGDNAHPLWKWMKTQKKGLKGDDIEWNFTKFIVDKTGKVVERSSPQTNPLDMEETLKTHF